MTPDFFLPSLNLLIVCPLPMGWPCSQGLPGQHAVGRNHSHLARPRLNATFFVKSVMLCGIRHVIQPFWPHCPHRQGIPAMVKWANVRKGACTHRCPTQVGFLPYRGVQSSGLCVHGGSALVSVNMGGHVITSLRCSVPGHVHFLTLQLAFLWLCPTQISSINLSAPSS